MRASDRTMAIREVRKLLNFKGGRAEHVTKVAYDLAERAIRLEREHRTLTKWLLATVEAIENTQGLKGEHTYIDRTHQEIALKARRVLLKLDPISA
jgi:hypothetical protein